MKLNILLAEDNLGDVLLVRKALDKHSVDYHLHVVRDGAEAIYFVSHMGGLGQKPCPNVMLLDLNLPKVDGPDVLREFRKHPECAHTPVVIISSSDSQKDRARISELGIAHYFRKPSDLAAFMKLGAIVRDVVASAQEV